MQFDIARILAYDILSTKFNEVVMVENKEQEIPSEFRLYQNYPNPFNPRTTIHFEIPEAAPVTLEVFNITGEKVATLLSKRIPAGRFSVDWDAGHLASGVYLYRLTVSSPNITRGKHEEIRKMMLIK
jgi:hypothetical protein